MFIENIVIYEIVINNRIVMIFGGRIGLEIHMNILDGTVLVTFDDFKIDQNTKWTYTPVI